MKREKAVHAQKHYTTELEKEKTKKKGLQEVANTVQVEFEVSITWCMHELTQLTYFNKDWISKAEKIGEKVEILRPLQTIQREHDALTRGLEQRDRT